MAYDINTIRAQFPALKLTFNGKPRVYLDNPAGTQVPQIVVDRMVAALTTFNANMNGNFQTSREATALVHEAHVAMADFYNAKGPEEIVFGPNMTTLTFMMARVLAPMISEGDEIISTHMEHDGNNTPWRTMARERGAEVKTLPFNRDTYEFDVDDLDALITDRTKFAAINYSSNILGTINNVKEICRRLKARGVITYVDAVQYAPHGTVDVQGLDCDFLVSSPYKYYGPHQGVLYGRGELLQQIASYKLRVVADKSPGKWETGCQSLEGQAGVIGAIEYMQWLNEQCGRVHEPTSSTLRERTRQIHGGMATMVEHEHSLSDRLIDGLQQIPGVVIRGITNPERRVHRVPTVSFTHDRVVPSGMAKYLDSHGVFVWDGLSYGLPVIEWLGLENKGGVVRVGPTHYNTVDEIDIVLNLISDYVSAL